MKTRQALICDDRREDAQKWSRHVKEQRPEGFEVRAVTPPEFFEAIKQVVGRRRDARRRGGPAVWRNCCLDEADILVVDYDLVKLDEHGYLTGEDVAYLCRCYSRCGLIVGLNQYGTNYFDLTLRGHPESYCDLNIGSDQLAYSGLWRETWAGRQAQFRPWYWPVLPDAQRAFSRRVAHVAKNLSAEIFSYLGFSDEDFATLPRSAKEFLGPGAGLRKATFADFVFKSGNGLSLKDKPADEASVARIAAARLWKWLERLVLAGQDILVDAPHLVSRYPSLLRGSPNSVAAWNQATSLSRGGAAVRSGPLREFEFKSADWLSRPAWFWRKVSGSEKIREVADPLSRQTPDFVFCEDISRFVEARYAREFVADVPSPFVRRFLASPSSARARNIDLAGVQYVPAVRLSL